MKFSFILHLLSPEEIEDRGMPLELIPYGVSVSEVVEAMLKQAQVVQYGPSMQITSQNGENCCGSHLIIPLVPQMILQDQNLALEMTASACQMAQEQGAEIIGLALMLGKIGRRGQDLKQRVDTPITNGDSYLVFNCLQVLMKLLDFFEREPEQEKVAIYGFPSAIGTLLSECLLSRGIDVTLVAKPTRHCRRFINETSGKYHASLGLASSLREAQKECKIIFTVGAEGQIVNVNELDKPAIIIDVSFPRNAPLNSGKALVIDTGIVSLSGRSLHVSGFYPNKVLPCLTELIILSLEERREDYSLGRNLTPAKVEEIGNLAQKYGFEVDTLYSFGKPVDMEYLSHFKHVFAY